MINKQQIEIEEMKNILLNSGAVTFEENVQKLYRQFHKDEFYVSNKDGHLTIDYSKFATALYNKNYRQIPEGTIVVDKEYLKKELQGLELQARKETANEFYDKFNENICSFKLENKSQEFIDGYAQAITDICGRLDQVAKQFGVEVDND